MNHRRSPFLPTWWRSFGPQSEPPKPEKRRRFKALDIVGVTAAILTVVIAILALLTKFKFDWLLLVFIPVAAIATIYFTFFAFK